MKKTAKSRSPLQCTVLLSTLYSFALKYFALVLFSYYAFLGSECHMTQQDLQKTINEAVSGLVRNLFLYT